MRFLDIQSLFSRTTGFILLLLLAVTFSVMLVYVASKSGVSHAQASFPIDLEGYAWSSTVGWISMNCANDGSCGSADYQVEINEDMTLTGFGWSSNIGWVKFGDLSGCPGSGSCDARIDTDQKELFGWARACAGTDPGDCSTMDDHIDGWDGWISLNCENVGTCADHSGDPNDGYRVQVGTGSLWSYAWGSDVVGWVDFQDVSFDNPCTPSLQCTADNSGREETDQWCNVTTTACPEGTMCLDSNPTQCVGEASGSLTLEGKLIPYGETTQIDWSATNVQDCTVIQGTVELGTWAATSGSVESQPVYGETEIKLRCTDLNGSEQEVDTATIHVIPISYES